MTTNGGGPARLLRAYWLWILLVTAVVSGGAVGVGLAATPTYVAEASVVVESRVLAGTTPVPPAMGTEKQVAQSGVVIGKAAQSLTATPGELMEGLTISVAPDADVLRFAYRHADPAVAQARAQEIAEAYVAYRNAAESKELTEDKAALGAAARSAHHATLVTPAGLPDTPAGRSSWVNLAAGLAIGLGLGIATALLRDRTSDRLRSRADFEQIIGAPVLATVPTLRFGPDELPLILRAPDSPAAESFRYLRSRLQALTTGRTDGTSVLVTSARDNEGRTTTAANLASALALAGLDVILVDTDFRQPQVDALFGQDNQVGLANVLTNECSARDALRPTTVPTLRVLTAGPPVNDMADLLEANRLRLTVEELRFACDFVVLDSAPVLSVSDPVALAAASDLVVIVADRKRTTRTSLAEALRELGDLGGRTVVGVLMNDPSKSPQQVMRRLHRRAPAAEPVSAIDTLFDSRADQPQAQNF